LTSDQQYRDERPIWLFDEMILFTRIDVSNKVSLWTITKDGLNLSQMLELDRLPDEGFGYFGYVDWGDQFDVWVPITKPPSDR
jgi:hypothetical protein